MSQDHFLTLAAGFLLGVLVTAATAGAFFQVRLATERERAERAAEEAEQERDRADENENKARFLRLEAERAADPEQPPPRTLSEEDKRRQEESQKRRQEAFWEEVEKERKKREMLPVPQVLPERPQRQP